MKRSLYFFVFVLSISTAILSCKREVREQDAQADIAETFEEAVEVTDIFEAVEVTDIFEAIEVTDIFEAVEVPEIIDEAETAEVLPVLKTKPPLSVPADPLEGTGIESCSIYLEEKCENAHLKRCSVYDTKAKIWVDKPDELLHRVFLFDRWRDLYNSPDGQAVDRDFINEVLPGTPEEQWGSPENFRCYCGAGDGGIWTGWATVAAVLRYSQTGTEADYKRMEQQVRDMVTMYDVTGIPGYLSRYHFLLLPAGAPNTDQHILRWEDSFIPHHHNRMIPNPEGIPNLPEIYIKGIKDSEGKVWKGKPMWRGRPSIDQNTGPMTSLPMAYGLLKDEALKEKIVYHLTCYLKRLQRVELINLQANPELLKAVMDYLNVGELKFDPDDIDLTKLDRIVGYVHRQINSLNEETFDMSCPDKVQMVPWRVLDATSETFVVDMLELFFDMDVNAERENGIDHFYFPNIRGADAMHMMHLSAIAYYFTGDEMYREFLFNELIGNLKTLEVVHTAGAFNLPKYCKKYYGDQITYGPWWAFLELLADSELKTAMQKAFHSEMWDKQVKVAGNVDFNIMYAGSLPDVIAKDKQEALSFALENLSWMGGNGGALFGEPFVKKWLDDPRRAYSLKPEKVLSWAPEGIVKECPTKKEIEICTAQITFMGITLPNLTGWSTFHCTGGEFECEVGGGECTRAMASKPLLIPLRPYTDYLWQRNPFKLGASVSFEGERQYAGSDLSVPYWNARRYGFIKEGQGQVLAWKSVGACE